MRVVNRAKVAKIVKRSGRAMLAIREVFEKSIQNYGARGCGGTFKSSECEPASEARRGTRVNSRNNTNQEA